MIETKRFCPICGSKLRMYDLILLRFRCDECYAISVQEFVSMASRGDL